MLMHELLFCDVVVCGPSTVALDAIFFDKPVILIDCYDQPMRDFEKISLWEYDHFRRVIEQHAATIARSKEELLNHITDALKNPLRLHEGRRKIKEAFCGYADGKSGERMAQEILQLLDPGK